jgi:ATP-dependent Zn protease
MNKETEIAYHEAGHALACYATGVRFNKVSIIPIDDSFGRLVHNRISTKMAQDLEWFDNTRTQIWHLQQIVISLAGAEATRLVCGKKGGHKGDYQSAKKYAEAECGVGETANAYSKFLLLLTRDFIKSKRKLLDKIAEELLKKKTLKYKELKELLQ